MRQAKAIAAGIVALLGLLLLRRGIRMDPQLEIALLTLVEAVVVYFVPNRPPERRTA